MSARSLVCAALLLLDAAAASARLGPARDRIEREGDDFRARVNEAYAELARRFPERIVALDASLPVDDVARAVQEDLKAHV
jgi:dTMP kinase